MEFNKYLQFLYGKFYYEEFFDLKKAINESNFKLKEIKNLFYFKSGRWDIETYSGLKIKLPKNNVKKSLNLSLDIIDKFDSKKIESIDLRQKRQIIINEQ